MQLSRTSFNNNDIHQLANADLASVPDLNEGSTKQVLENYRHLLERIENVVQHVSPQSLKTTLYEDVYKLANNCEKAIQKLGTPQKTEVLGHCKKIEDAAAQILWHKQAKNFDSFCKEDLNIQDTARINKIKKEFGIDNAGIFQIEGKTLILSKQNIESMQERYFWSFLDTILKEHPTIETIQITGESEAIPLKLMQKIMARKINSTSTSPPIIAKNLPLYFIADKKVDDLEVEEVKKGKLRTVTLPVLLKEAKSIPVNGFILELLAADSPYFKAALEGEFLEKQDKRIALPEEISPEQFLKAMDSLYGTRKMTQEDLLPFLKIADYFVIPTLADKCIELMNNQRRVSNYSDQEIRNIRKQYTKMQTQFPGVNVGAGYVKFYEDLLSRAFGTPKFFEILDECVEYHIPITSLSLYARFGAVDWQSSLKALRKLPTLKTLHIESDQIQDQDFKLLARLRLDTLSFKGGGFTGQGLRYLKNMNLQNLHLTWSSKLTDLSYLARLTSLKTLDLECSFALPPDQLQHVAALPNLQSLNLLSCTNIDNSGLQHLSGMASLRVLNLEANKKVDETGLSHLPKGLEELNLQRCEKINNDALVVIGQNLRNLRKLDLAFANITDTGLHHMTSFEPLPPISDLNLSYCPQISHAGVQYLLSGFPIERLKLVETNVDSKELKEIDDLVFKTFGRRVKDLEISKPEDRHDYFASYY